MNERVHETYKGRLLFTAERPRPGTREGPGASEPRLRARACAGLCVVVAALALAPGCAAPDTRISLAELERLGPELQEKLQELFP